MKKTLAVIVSSLVCSLGALAQVTSNSQPSAAVGTQVMNLKPLDAFSYTMEAKGGLTQRQTTGTSTTNQDPTASFGVQTLTNGTATVQAAIGPNDAVFLSPMVNVLSLSNINVTASNWLDGAHFTILSFGTNANAAINSNNVAWWVIHH